MTKVINPLPEMQYRHVIEGQALSSMVRYLMYRLHCRFNEAN